ncbi:hypothetical protein [Rhodoferax sp.]|uniref:hypothetical protein n=1 Tax=Rhodoferax sp. TaxID=50421 RepID=UPI00374CB9B5
MSAIALLAVPAFSVSADTGVTRSVEIATCVGPFMAIASNTGISQIARSEAQRRVDVLLSAFEKETSKDAMAQGITKEQAARSTQEQGKARNVAILGAAAAKTDPSQRSEAIRAYLDGCSALAAKLQTEH